MKRKDGFQGEKHIYIPEAAWKAAAEHNVFMSNLYVTSMGYFPNAAFHYRDRPEGCSENILIYCLRGKGWFLLDDHKMEVAANEYIIVPTTKVKMSYGADDHEPWTIYWIHFCGKDLEEFNRGFNLKLYDGAKPIHLNEKGIQIWESMYQNLQLGYNKDNLSNISLCLCHLLATFFYPEKHTSVKDQDERDMIKKTIDYMHQALANKITLEDLAAINNLSVSYFASLFRKATGMPPMDYFIHLKVRKACGLLFSTEIKIRDIASSLGYEDPFHFSRLFKKSMRVSPQVYRELRRKRSEASY
ncbi:AraC family transcriptional regulator [Pedobacter frigidisoli]|uniref:AraC family transcriptional regulator n=1 Tax=Pedobacter frigidisoli TaxID=2530455 RepID=UPI002931A19C|nr:AraC family transcriptional regulator [Pedobacter frigidisoli]